MSSGAEEGALARSLCWHCQSQVGGEYFCEKCVKIQPISEEIDHFKRLGFPRHLNIDQKSLEKRFHEQSRQFHPDFFQGRSDEEMAISLENSASLNAAHRTLADPIRRVEYLISLEEGAVKEIPAKAPPDLLEEILELQESLETYRQARKTDTARAAALRKTLQEEKERITARKTDLEKELFELFGEWDRDCTPAAGASKKEERGRRETLIDQMKDRLSSRAYLNTLIRDMEKGLEES